jgi:hypothetical protein
MLNGTGMAILNHLSPPPLAKPSSANYCDMFQYVSEWHSPSIDGSMDNVDAVLFGSPILSSSNEEYVDLTCRNLQTLEDNALKPDKPVICGTWPEMRTQIVDWMTWMVLDYMFLDHVLFTGIWIFDVVCATIEVEPSHLTLVAASSLWIAAKFDEVENPSVQNFVRMSQYQFTTQEFIDMEATALRAIGFNVGRPNSIDFMELVLSQIPIDDDVTTCAKFYCHVAAFAGELAFHRPSHIAIAAVILGKLAVNLKLSLQVAIRMLPILDQGEVETCLSVMASTAEFLTAHSASIQRKYCDLFSSGLFDLENVASVVQIARSEKTIGALIENA